MDISGCALGWNSNFYSISVRDIVPETQAFCGVVVK